VILSLLPTKILRLYLVQFRKYNNLKSQPHVKTTAPQHQQHDQNYK